ncbi:MAG: terpene cyclase/mutase family protein, partial [Planctomycetales bacterium]|nr:terpene cyclase/mutase family protein [Planctomycetales bacterium]
MTIGRRRFLAGMGAAGLVAAAAPSRLLAQLPDGENPELSAAEMVTPATQAAINRGLAYLARRQRDDGAFGNSGYSRNVAVCSIAGMSFMAGGSMPGRGPYGAVVDRVVDYILANTQERGFIMAEGATSHGPMYGHGFATLFLAEAFGMTWRMDVGEKLALAVKQIINTQNKDGGWRYLPERKDADISVTVCQVMALRAARNAGIFVPPETIDAAVEYVKRSQNPDGGFMYELVGGPSLFPRSAAGVVALYSAGIYEGSEIEKGLDYLMQHRPKVGSRADADTHYFYGHYYAVQAMWHAGGQNWNDWYPAIRDQLLARQR